MMQSKLLKNISGIRHGFLNEGVLPDLEFYRCHQVHGKEIITVSASISTDEVKDQKADGLFSEENPAVAIQTADCIPALFVDRSGKFIAAVHAGWRGVQQHILIETVRLFERSGVKPQNILVALGPCIRACCFEVDQSTIAAFGNESIVSNVQPRSMNPKRSQAKPSSNNLWLDLAQIATEQLKSTGMKSDQIDDPKICTYCGSTTLASYRRSTHENTKAGRQWSWIGRE
jgi:YfiH family protein